MTVKCFLFDVSAHSAKSSKLLNRIFFYTDVAYCAGASRVMYMYLIKIVITDWTILMKKCVGSRLLDSPGLCDKISAVISKILI